MSETKAQILVIGQVQGVITDADALDPRVFDLYDNVLDGTCAASSQAYHAIVLIKRGLEYALRQIIEAVQSHNHAPIYVLTDVVDEPEIRSLVTASGTGGVRDYLISPVTLSQVHHMLFPVAPSVPRDDLGPRLEMLEKLATEDDLTGLKNRRYIWEFLRQILERAHQDAGRVTLMVYDIDDFKHYNDCYGHPTGDRILKEAAELMSRCCRSHDVVGRIGGDEFAVIFWDDPLKKRDVAAQERRMDRMDHPREPIFIAKRFQHALERANLDLLGPGGKGVLSISGGLASYPYDGDTVEQLFEKADEALMEAKRSGKNRVYLVGSEQNDIAHFD
ncbi:MAG: GGDEF domain-containing protein [Planctomycetes bacterium]|nr:GGDEF domain-containing protein [Planctomycetota bacterium]